MIVTQIIHKRLQQWCIEDIDLFKREIKFYFGNMGNYAEACGISRQYLSLLLSKKRECPIQLYNHMMEVFNDRKRLFKHRSTLD